MLTRQSGESWMCGLLDGNKVKIYANQESPRTLRYILQPGNTLELLITALGKALLGAMDAAERNVTIDTLSFENITADSITSPAALRAQIETRLEKKYFINPQ